MPDQKDPLGILSPAQQPSKNGTEDPLGILKKKDQSSDSSSNSPLDSTPVPTVAPTSDSKSDLHENIFGTTGTPKVSKNAIKVDANKQHQESITNDLKNADAGMFADAKGSLIDKATNAALEKAKSDKERAAINTRRHELSEKFYNGNLSGDDINYIRGGVAPDVTQFSEGLSNDQIAGAINSKTKNLNNWANHAMVKGAVNVNMQLQTINNKIKELEGIVHIGQDDTELKNLRQQKDFLRHSLTQVYNSEKEKVVPSVLSDLKTVVGQGKDWQDIMDESYPKAGEKPFDVNAADTERKGPFIRYNPKSHTLTPESTASVINFTNEWAKKKDNKILQIGQSGNSFGTNDYSDLGKSVVDYLNTVPAVDRGNKAYVDEYKKKNKSLAPLIDHQEQIRSYFTDEHLKEADAYVKSYQDKNFVINQEKYWGKNGTITTNPEFVKISHKYADAVGRNEMTEDVAKNQIWADAQNNPVLQKLIKSQDGEIEEIREKGRDMWADYLTKGITSKVDPNLVVYKNGNVGVKGMGKNEAEFRMDQFNHGLVKNTAETLHGQANELMLNADQRAEQEGAFVGSMKQSGHEMAGAFYKWFFDKTGWGGEDATMFEAKNTAEIPVTESDVAKAWNWKGISSLLDPKFYASKVGSMIPVIVPSAIATAVTEGAAAPEAIQWLSAAGIFTAQDALSFRQSLINTTDSHGNKLTDEEVDQAAANQARDEFLPNLAFMALNTGTLMRTKAITKPTFGGAVKQAVVGSLEGAAPMAVQGYLSYANGLEAQGQKPDMWDYMQDGHFATSLIDGIVGGLGIQLAHVPGNYVKQLQNWKHLITQSEGEFHNNAHYNNALQMEMNGGGNYMRDAIKLHLLNGSYNGPEEKAGWENLLQYSTALDRNIKGGNLNPKNVHDLYQAHNLALADLNEGLAERNSDNKNLSAIYKDQAKNYREQAKSVVEGKDKFHYLIDRQGDPIFLSDQSFKHLDADGKIAEWLREGTVQDIHSSDDPNFAKEYKNTLKVEAPPPFEPKMEEGQHEDIIQTLKDNRNNFSPEGEHWIGTQLDKPDMSHEDIANALISQAVEHGGKKKIEEMIGSKAFRQIEPFIDEQKALRAEEKDQAEKDKEAGIEPEKKPEKEGRPSIEEYKPQIRDDYFAKADFFTTEEKEKFAQLDDAGKDKMIDDKRSELKKKPSEVVLTPEGPSIKEVKIPEPKGKPTDFVTKSGNQRVLTQDGKLVVVDKEGKPVSRATEKKALREYAEAYDFSVGERAPEIPTGTMFKDEQELKSWAVEHSQNPTELAAIYKDEEPVETNLSTTERMIYDFGGLKTTTSSYDQFGDRNNRGISMAKSYLDNEKGEPLDQIAKEMSDHYGVEITPQDLVEFMDRFPGGTIGAAKESEVAIQAKNKFKELTGLDLTQELAGHVIDREFDTLDQLNHDLLNDSYDNETQLTEKHFETFQKNEPTKAEGPNDTSKQQVERSPEAQAHIDELKAALERLKESGDTDTKGLEDRISELEGGGEPPKEIPPAEPQQDFGSDWTAIRKAELTSAKNAFKPDRTSLKEEFDSAMTSLAAQTRPNETMYDAAARKTDSFFDALSNGERPNPNTEDLAIMHYQRTVLREKQASLEDPMFWGNEFERAQAVKEFNEFSVELAKVDAVLGGTGSEAGKAFLYRQAESRLDPERGLTIRRMELSSAKGGGELTDAEEDKVHDLWNQEMQAEKEHDAEVAKADQAEFERRVQEEVNKRLKKLGRRGKLTVEEKKSVANKLRGFADRIENLGRADLPEGTQRQGFDIQKSVANAIRYVADKIENGHIPDLIESAIKKFIGEGDEKELREEIKKQLLEAGLSQEDINEKTTLGKIGEMDHSGSITNDMVKKGYINDFIHSYIDEGLDIKDILNTAEKDLKKILPDVTDDQLRDAYLKQNAYKVPTRAEAEQSRASKIHELQTLEKIKSDLAELEEKGTIMEKEGKNLKKVHAEIEKKRAELKDNLIRAGIKIDRTDKFTKSSRKLVAASHNKRLESLRQKFDWMLDNPNLSEAAERMLKSATASLEDAKINLGTIEDVEQLINKSEQKLKALSALAGRGMKDIENLETFSAVRKAVDGALRDLKKDQNMTEQAIKMNNYENTLRSDIDKIGRDMAAGNFDEKPVINMPQKSAAAIRLEIRKRNLESVFNKIKDRARDQNKSKFEKVADIIQKSRVASLIFNVLGLPKIAMAAGVKPVMETVTRASTGQFYGATLGRNVRKAYGSEGFSTRSEKRAWEATVGAMTHKTLEARVQKGTDDLHKYDSELRDVTEKANQILAQYGADSKEYKSFESKTLKPAQAKQRAALLDNAANGLYQWMLPNAWQDAVNIMVNNAARIEEIMGNVKRVDPKDLESWQEKYSYYVDSMGRIHSMLKNFSARNHFARGYIRRVENAQARGEDIQDPSRLVQIANDAFNQDFLAGKYMNNNLLVDFFKGISSALETGRIGNLQFDKDNRYVGLRNVAAKVLRFDSPIIKVPSNILNEAVFEYTFGSIVGGFVQGKEAIKGLAKSKQEGADWKEAFTAMQNHLATLDTHTADLIGRSFRKGGVGLGLFSLGALTFASFSGFYRKGEKQKPGDIPYNRLMFGDHKLEKHISNAITHQAFMMPFMMGANFARVKEMGMKKGKTEMESWKEGMVSDLEATLDELPYRNALDPTEAFTTLPIPGIGLVKDVEDVYEEEENSNGEPTPRSPQDIYDRIKMQSGLRMYVPTKVQGDAINRVKKAAEKERAQDRAKGIGTTETDAKEKKMIDDILKK